MNIERLSLFGNPIQTLPSSLGLLSNLRTLALDDIPATRPRVQAQVDRMFSDRPDVPFWMTTPQRHPRCAGKNSPYLVKWSTRGDACFTSLNQAFECSLQVANNLTGGFCNGGGAFERGYGRAPVGCLKTKPARFPFMVDLETGGPCRVDSISNETFPTHWVPLTCAEDEQPAAAAPPALDGPCKACAAAAPCFGTPGGCSASGERVWEGAFAACKTEGAAQCADMGCFPDSLCNK